MRAALELLREEVRGRSVAEVGGLLNPASSVLPPAWLFGAKDLTLVDVCPPGLLPWKRYAKAVKPLGFSYAEVSSDVCAYKPKKPFDVVFCAGVLYHHPEPLAILKALRRLARRRIVLSTYVAPPGLSSVDLRKADAPTRAAVRKWLGPTLSRDALKPRKPWGSDEFFENWYVLPSEADLSRLARSAGLAVSVSSDEGSGRARTLVLKKA